jgi:hypothetical protein
MITSYGPLDGETVVVAVPRVHPAAATTQHAMKILGQCTL